MALTMEELSVVSCVLCIFILFYYWRIIVIGVYYYWSILLLPYDGVLVSAVQQSESALYIYPLSLEPPSIPSHPTLLGHLRTQS